MGGHSVTYLGDWSSMLQEVGGACGGRGERPGVLTHPFLSDAGLRLLGAGGGHSFHSPLVP